MQARVVQFFLWIEKYDEADTSTHKTGPLSKKRFAAAPNRLAPRRLHLEAFSYSRLATYLVESPLAHMRAADARESPCPHARCQRLCTAASRPGLPSLDLHKMSAFKFLNLTLNPQPSPSPYPSPYPSL